MNNSTINDLKERREKIMRHDEEEAKRMECIQREYSDGHEVRKAKICELNEAIYILENPHMICSSNSETPIITKQTINTGNSPLIIKAIKTLRKTMLTDVGGVILCPFNDGLQAKITELTNLL